MVKSNTSFARRVGAGLVAVALASALAGCTSHPDPTLTPTPEDEVTAAATAFLGALSQGNGTTALAMTTTSKNDLACGSMWEDGQQAEIDSASVLSVQVNERSATADVAYHLPVAPGMDAPEDIAMTLSLEQRDGEWLVVLPDSYRIHAVFDAPLVAVATIERVTSGASQYPTCDVTVRDGEIDVAALPGRYMATYSDPTGVMDYAGATTTHLVGGSEDMGWRRPGLPGTDNAFGLQSRVFDTVTSVVSGCVSSLYERPAACPKELDGAVLLGEDGLPQTDGFPNVWATADRIWTEDDETWLFSTEPVRASLMRDGVPFDLNTVYTGHFEVDDDGEVIVVVDGF